AIHSQCKGTLVFIGVFIFCALTSSLLGTGWALSDFLADGLNIPKNRRGRLLLGLLSFIPPIIYTLCFPNGFLKAIGFAGALSAILVIIYPVLMAWKFRSKQYLAKHNHQDNFVGISKYKAPVNNITMLIILLIGWLIVGLEFVNNI
ncbi:MAG: aromatic amino acid transport family protein, partial [Gammaproteobacteria bacterium]